MNISFASLVMLFSEFIRLNLFSPMQFMCNLVAHGLNDNHENNNSHIIPNPHSYKQHVYNTMIRHDTFNMDSNSDRRFIDLDPLEAMNCKKFLFEFKFIFLLFSITINNTEKSFKTNIKN
jgi:hypothetical protein